MKKNITRIYAIIIAIVFALSTLSPTLALAAMVYEDLTFVSEELTGDVLNDFDNDSADYDYELHLNEKPESSLPEEDLHGDRAQDNFLECAITEEMQQPEYVNIMPSNITSSEGLRINVDVDTRVFPSDGYANVIFPIEMFTLATSYDGIVASFSGTYAMEVQTNDGIAHIPVGKLEIDLTNDVEVTAALHRSDLTYEMREDILSLRQEVIDGLVDELTITIFSEILLPESIIQPFGRRYLTYNGMQMRTDTTFINGRNTGHQRIQTGTNTRNVAANIFHTSLIVAGNVSTTIGVAESIVSIWQLWVNSGRPHVITASNQDFLEMRLIFNEQRQRTYGSILGGWVLGMTTQRVTITNLGIEQHFFNNGNGCTFRKDRVTNVMAQSQNFNFPWTRAHGNVGLRPTIINEWVSWRVHNSTFLFS